MSTRLLLIFQSPQITKAWGTGCLMQQVTKEVSSPVTGHCPGQPPNWGTRRAEDKLEQKVGKPALAAEEQRAFIMCISPEVP